MAILFIIFLLLLGGVVGFRIGTHFSRRENEVILTNNGRLQEFSNQWFNVAKHSLDLITLVAEKQTSNLSGQVHTLVQLLQSLQAQQTLTQNKEEAAKIERLIEHARSIASP